MSLPQGAVRPGFTWVPRPRLGPVGLSCAVAYADAASDAPLLRACGSPVAVNPDARLRSLASASGWPILRLH